MIGIRQHFQNGFMLFLQSVWPVSSTAISDLVEFFQSSQENHSVDKKSRSKRRERRQLRKLPHPHTPTIRPNIGLLDVPSAAPLSANIGTNKGTSLPLSSDQKKKLSNCYVKETKEITLPPRLELGTSRLTVERASQLRHGRDVVCVSELMGFDGSTAEGVEI